MIFLFNKAIYWNQVEMSRTMIDFTGGDFLQNVTKRNVAVIFLSLPSRTDWKVMILMGKQYGVENEGRNVKNTILFKNEIHMSWTS